MKTSKTLILALAVGMALVVAACGHKLVAHNPEGKVEVYPDQSTFHKVVDLKKQGGPAAMLGGLGDQFLAKKVEDKTPVTIISQDVDGAQIEVTDGPDKGTKGFVAIENLD
jgi:hypothetical protein